MSQACRALSIHTPVVQEAAKAVAELYCLSMLSRSEINELIRGVKFGHDDIIYSPKMAPFATGTRYSKGLVHRGRRIVCADELHNVFLSFRLHSSLPVLRKKINTAFCNIPPEAIVAWHRKIVDDLFRLEASAGVGVAVVGASTLNGGDAPAVASVEGAVGSTSQADTESAAISSSNSSSGPADDNVESDVGVLGDGDVVSLIVNNAPKAGAAALVREGTPDREGTVIFDCLPGSLDDIVDPPSLAGAGVGGVDSITTDASAEVIEAAAVLAKQADNDHLSIKVAEADGSRDPSLSEPLIVNDITILPADSESASSLSSTMTVMVSEALSLPACKVDDGSSDASSSSKDGALGKRALPIDDDVDVASPSQAGPKRQKRNWWPPFWF